MGGQSASHRPARQPVNDSPDESLELRVTDDQAGVRLDVFLARSLSVGRQQVRRMLEQQAVMRNGKRQSLREKGKLLQAGDVVRVEAFERPERAVIEPRTDLPLNILAEGRGWLVVDKPAGMAVHPLSAGERDTVLNAAVARYPQMQGVGEGGLRSGVVHRLDVDTSGTLALAMTQPARETLRQAFARHETQKVYRAIVRGGLTGQRRLVLDLVVAQHHPARVAVVERGVLPKPPGVRRCDLTWGAVESFGDRATLLEVTLGTGFLHQIRVMLAHIGHPVLGDAVYGDPAHDPVPVPRQMLHASSLRAGPAEAHSPDPPDFADALRRLEGR